MKRYSLSLLVLCGALLATSCNDLNEQEPAGNKLSTNQMLATNEMIPERAAATFSGMFNYLGTPGIYGTARADDFGAISGCFVMVMQRVPTSF